MRSCDCKETSCAALLGLAYGVHARDLYWERSCGSVIEEGKEYWGEKMNRRREEQSGDWRYCRRRGWNDEDYD